MRRPARIAAVTAALALVTAAPTMAAPSPTLHQARLSGQVTSLSTTCHANLSERTQAAYAAEGTAEGRLAGTFTTEGVVQHARLTPRFSSPAVLEATAHDATVELTSGATTALVTLALAPWEGTEVRCGGGLGGELASASTRTAYTAVVTGPGGTTTERGVAEGHWHAVHPFGPDRISESSYELRFKRRGGRPD